MSSPTIESVRPTVFYTREGGRLVEQTDVCIDNPGNPCECELEVIIGDEKYTYPLSILEGKRTYRVAVPATSKGVCLTARLIRDSEPAGTFAAEWYPRKRWEVYFVPIAHHDLGYTDPIDKLLWKYTSFYEDVVRFCQETDGLPEVARYRYTVETSWSLDHFLQNADPETIAEFMRYARKGRIEVSAFYGNVIDASCGHEELIRALYPSFKLKREYGIPITTASIVDIPGLSWSLPAILSRAGVRFFFAGLPTYFEWQRPLGQPLPGHTFWDETRILRHGRPDAFKWRGPDGSEVLVYYQGSYGFFSSVTGPESFDEVLENLPRFLDEMEDSGCPFSVARFIDHGTDNYPPCINISHIVQEWNKRFVYPKLIVSTNQMFFARLETECEDLRVLRGELPHTDYTVCATSAAQETGTNRRSHDGLVAAEKLAVIDQVLTGANYPAGDITRAYSDMLLFDEHCYGMSRPFGQIQDWDWNSKSHYAYRAAGITESLLTEATRHISSKVRGNCDETYITVFNPLSFSRDDVVRVADFGPREKAFRIIDEETGEEVPYQLAAVDDPRLPLPYASQRYAMSKSLARPDYDLVFVGKNIPAMGYKRYRFEAVDRSVSYRTDVGTSELTLENGFYRLRLDGESGAIESIFDKELGREVVDPQAGHGLNQLVVHDVESGRFLSPQSVQVLLRETGPVYSSLLVLAECEGCPQLVQEVILYSDLKRIDISNRVLKDQMPFQEFYFAFPFKLENPRFRYEGTNSVIVPFVDQFPGSNTNYYAVQHWAEVANDEVRVLLSPVEAHILEFGGLWANYVSQAHHGLAPAGFGEGFIDPAQVDKGYMYSLVINSNYRTNFSPVQLGDMLFRYSITTGDGAATAVKPHRFGWSRGTPLLSSVSQGNSNGTLGKTMSFCQVEPENVLLSAMKRAENQKGIIIRLTETEGEEARAVVRFLAVPPKRAYETSIVEEGDKETPVEGDYVRVPIRPYEIKTIRVEM